MVCTLQLSKERTGIIDCFVRANFQLSLFRELSQASFSGRAVVVDAIDLHQRRLTELAVERNTEEKRPRFHEAFAWRTGYFNLL